MYEKLLIALQVRFSEKGLKPLHKFTSENLKNKWLEDRCLARIHSDIHSVCTNPQNPVDVRNDPK